MTVGLARRKKIGVIEVGSRAVRYLVGYFELDGTFHTDRTAAPFIHDIMIDQIDQIKVDELLTAVDAYHRDLQTRECDGSIVYGTALCRRLREIGQTFPAYLKVFTPEQEAYGSWAAGFLSRRTQSDFYTIVDQGSGSTEIISASWTAAGMSNVKTQSLDFGSQRLASLYDEIGSKQFPKELLSLLDKSVQQFDTPAKKGGRGEIVCLGSAATKLAFNIKHKKDLNDDYRSGAVNGTKLNVSEIFKHHTEMSAMFREDPDRTRNWIDRRVNEYEIVMSSSIFLMLMTIKYGFQDITVSANGTRHGVGFLIRRGLT